MIALGAGTSDHNDPSGDSPSVTSRAGREMDDSRSHGMCASPAALVEHVR